AQAEGLTVVAVRNSCIDQLRRNSRRAECPIDPVAEEVADTDPQSDRAELYESVRAIINGQLSERERQVITMRDTQGYSFAEIAAELNITETNARMILSRARKAVREIYLSSKK
ncbi:MAG: sigma-70 family RNA polymerase sigma factor, partial [Muribaculaceae bacterium]|nr:sigma-70 family RNA polymerase sigma factor [Muribaculaceae bacterium]